MKYEIARVETRNIDTNEELLPPYYKVYSNDGDGCVELETECETLDDAYDFIHEKGERMNKYAEEDLKCALEDLAWWVKEQLDETPLIFRNDQIQEKFYKLVKEYRSE